MPATTTAGRARRKNGSITGLLAIQAGEAAVHLRHGQAHGGGRRAKQAFGPKLQAVDQRTWPSMVQHRGPGRL